MKTSNQSVFLLLAILLILLACNKEPNPPISQSDMWDCHSGMTWDSLKTANALIGEWEWEYISCFSGLANDSESKGLTIEFKSDNTLDVKQDGETTQISTWEVVERSTGFFKVDVAPSVNQLNGLILFCDERIEFQSSESDGCDDYFKRKE